MAKFYARLVLMTVGLVFGSSVLIIYNISTYTNRMDLTANLPAVFADGLQNGMSVRINDTRWRRNILVTDPEYGVDPEYSWPETREALDMCRNVSYAGLPLSSMSVVICFHNKESLSNLLHTVHAVYQRTPQHLLTEIILIDDFSQKTEFGRILEVYFLAVFGKKVRIIRNKQRMGLIRSRLRGIRAATAEVVSVMDSHVEVQPGWAESLLNEIRINPTTLAASYVDWIEQTDGGKLKYRYGGVNWKTYFDWTFVFGWQTMSKEEINARKSLIEPIRAPVIIGTIFAIRRDYFFKVGGFDERMHLWGGENLDLPVRVWLFGGQVVNVPCSRAGHMEFSGSRDYRLSNEFETNKFINYRRFAEVWASDFKQYFFMYTPETQAVDPGDLTQRNQLHATCPGNFSWYIREIFPELGIPDQDGLAWGELRNVDTQTCLDTMNSIAPGLQQCGQSAARQGVYWSKTLTLRMPIHIFNYNRYSDPEHLVLDEYISYHNSDRASQFVHFKDGPIIEVNSRKCLIGNGNDIKIGQCDQHAINQRWTFMHYTPDYDRILQPNKNDRVGKLYTEMFQTLLRYFPPLRQAPGRTRRP